MWQSNKKERIFDLRCKIGSWIVLGAFLIKSIGMMLNQTIDSPWVSYNNHIKIVMLLKIQQSLEICSYLEL